MTFYDGTSYAASLKKRDGNLGFGIYAVNRAEIQQSTWSQIKTAVLGSSNAVSKGNPVIVIGKQFGYEGGIGLEPWRQPGILLNGRRGIPSDLYRYCRGCGRNRHYGESGRRSDGGDRSDGV